MNREKPSLLKSSVGETYLSDRGIRDYIKNLDISETDLDVPGAVILDLGAGTEQNLAKEVRERSLRSKIISIDPRLGLHAVEDLLLMKEQQSEKQNIKKRIRNRKNVEPLTIAALSQNLPLREGAVDHIYALYSVPYYLEGDVGGIKKTLHEAVRVLKPGGTIRTFPITEDNLADVKNILEKIKNINFTLTPDLFQKDNIDNKKDYLLIIKKKESKNEEDNL